MISLLDETEFKLLLPLTMSISGGSQALHFAKLTRNATYMVKIKMIPWYHVISQLKNHKSLRITKKITYRALSITQIIFIKLWVKTMYAFSTSLSEILLDELLWTALKTTRFKFCNTAKSDSSLCGIRVPTVLRFSGSIKNILPSS